MKTVKSSIIENTNSLACQPVARYLAPELSLSNEMSLQLILSTIGQWNESLKNSLPGIGFYGSDPQSDMEDDSLHHFVLFADELFFTAFMESHEEIQVTSVPAEDMQQSAA